jgi:hypothetical protein
VFGVNIREDDIVEDVEDFVAGLRLLDEGFNPFGGGAFGPDTTTEPLSVATISIEDNDCKLP